MIVLRNLTGAEDLSMRRDIVGVLNGLVHTRNYWASRVP